MPRPARRSLRYGTAAGNLIDDLALLRHFLDGHEGVHRTRAARAWDRRNQPSNQKSTHRRQRERYIGPIAPTRFFRVAVCVGGR
jgi:hypothetical protein